MISTTIFLKVLKSQNGLKLDILEVLTLKESSKVIALNWKNLCSKILKRVH